MVALYTRRALSLLSSLCLSFSAQAQEDLRYEWREFYGGTSRDDANAIVACPEGGYVVVGRSFSINGQVSQGSKDGSVWVIKVSESGQLVWEKSYSAGASPYINTMTIDQQQNFVIAGSANPEFRNAYLLKLNSKGGKRWLKTYNFFFNGQAINKIITLKDGNYLTIGTSTTTGSTLPDYLGGNDMWVMKLDTSGTVLWQYRYGGTASDYGYDIAELKNGNIVLVGSTDSQSGDIKNPKGKSDAWVLLIDPQGTILKSNCYGSAENEEGRSFLELPDGTFMIGGRGNKTFIPNSSQITTKMLLKLDNRDSVEWKKSFGDNFTQQIQVILMDGPDRLLAIDAVSSRGYLTSLDLKGNILWTKRTDNIRGVAKRGDAYVLAGDWFTDATPYDYILTKTCGNLFDTIVVRGRSLSARGRDLSFQWVDCQTGQALEGDTFSLLQPKKDGHYKVIVKRGGCADTSRCYPVFSTSAELEPLTNEGFSIQPNPAEHYVTILGHGDFFLHIYTGQGQEIGQYSLKDQATLSVQELPRGLYLFELISAGKTLRHKILIK